MMNESSIMRRCKDDWVNATQILKCCNFPKAKRTKILEKGVQQGLHEKEAAAAAAAAAAASTGTGPGNTLPITTSASGIISQLSATTPANVAIQGNSQIQTGQIHDVMSSQDTFNSISRQNSYIPPTAQQLPHMYNMSQSTPASSQQPIDNGNTLIGTSNGGFGQPEFQPVSNNNMPAYPNDIQNFQMFQRMQQQQQQQQQQQMPTQQRFFQNGSAPNPIHEPIDAEGHTPLHWAASIGNFEMIHLLLSKGANPLVVNNFGLNPLSKLISFNNCFELKNFPTVLDDLELCLINTDINGRTPLHYLCQFAKSKTKNDSLVYYLKVILNKLTILSNQSQVRQINLLNFFFKIL